MRKSAIGVVVFSVLFASTAQAAWTGSHTIKTYKMEPGGLLLVLDGFVNTSEVVCTGTDAFYLRGTDPNFEVRSAILLAAFVAGQEIAVSFYSCAGYSATVEYLKLGSIVLSSTP